MRRARLRIAKRQADHLHRQMEAVRLGLPEALRYKSFDDIAAMDDHAVDHFGATYGIGFIAIVQLLIAAWPLLKELWEMIQELDSSHGDGENTDHIEIKCEP